MIEFSETLQNILMQPALEYFYLVRIYDINDNTIYCITTYFNEITFQDNVYEANAALVSIDPPQLSSTVDREQYKINIADPLFTTGEFADNGLVGKRVAVHIGFINPENNQPLLNDNEVLTSYVGRIDANAYKLETDEIGESILQITCSSPMSDLDLKKNLYLSKDAVKRRNPEDTCCDQIYEGSNKSVLKWGKE
jgi:hypothetical protein